MQFGVTPGFRGLLSGRLDRGSGSVTCPGLCQVSLCPGGVAWPRPGRTVPTPRLWPELLTGRGGGGGAGRRFTVDRHDRDPTGVHCRAAIPCIMQFANYLISLSVRVDETRI